MHSINKGHPRVMAGTRNYPTADVKILWGKAAARCAFPQCRVPCVAEETKSDSAKTYGRIAHIYAHSNSGPRANNQMNKKERDSYDNWILLCANHHDVVDKQEKSYPANLLIEWKAEHEKWVKDRLAKEMTSVSFVELEIVTQAIIASPNPKKIDFDITPIHQKIKKNNLSPNIEYRISMGLLKVREVQDFLSDISKRIPNFSDKVIQGFIDAYNSKLKENLSEDALFEELHSFAAGGSQDFDKLSAGLAVLVYLFEKCEVFEK